MAWRNYEIRHSGDCEVRGPDGISLIRFNMGIVETGRTRVFAGYFVRLILCDRDPILGEDEHSLRASLWRLARNIEPLGLIISCVGLSGEFNESGLSMDTGWGYFGRHNEPMHMLDPVPSDNPPDEDVDETIRQAVRGMRIGISPTFESVPQRSEPGEQH